MKIQFADFERRYFSRQRNWTYVEQGEYERFKQKHGIKGYLDKGLEQEHIQKRIQKDEEEKREQECKEKKSDCPT